MQQCVMKQVKRMTIYKVEIDVYIERCQSIYECICVALYTTVGKIN